MTDPTRTFARFVSRRAALWTLSVSAGLAFGCGAEDGGGGATGGNAPLVTGGTTGGTLASGGTTGGKATGGTPATGGVSSGGTGAVATTGGVAPAGGVAATGGSTGGTPAAGGGSGGMGGSAGKSQGGAAMGGSSSGGASAAGAGGAPSGGAGGSAGGSAGFNPCPASEPCKVLPLGDSITDGVGVSGGGGYRIELFAKSVMDNKNMTFVGRRMNGPMTVAGETFPRNHEGYSGYTIARVDMEELTGALGTNPHIVLVHLGTNDMYQMPSGADMRLGTLIDKIVTALPDALVVVSNIIPFPQQSGAVTTFNSAVPGVVMKRAMEGKHVVFVDQFKDFPNGELADGVHPNTAGYARMAGKWYDAIKQYLR